MTPVVSIIIRTYNLAHYLPAALESVRTQSYPHWEALVLDDASEDTTRQVIAPYCAIDQRIKYVRNQTRLGRARNLNLGLRLARGTYISVLDADDVWCSPCTLQKVVGEIKSCPETALVTVGIAEIDAQGVFVRRFHNLWRDHGEIKKRLLIENFLSQNAVCFRAADARTLRGYDERLQYTEDYEFWLRLGLHGKIKKLPEVLAHYRIHPGSVGVRKRRAQIVEEIKVAWRYRTRYPYISLALLHRFINLCITFIPKRIRHAIAITIRYHQFRTRWIHSLTSGV